MKMILPIVLVSSAIAGCAGAALAQQAPAMPGAPAFQAQQPGMQQPGVQQPGQTARITLPDAIAAAERQANGKATGADLKRDNGLLLYEVDVATQAGKMVVYVDAQSGQVLPGSQIVDHENGQQGEHRDGDGEDGNGEEENGHEG